MKINQPPIHIVFYTMLLFMIILSMFVRKEKTPAVEEMPEASPDKPIGAIYVPMQYRDILAYHCEQEGVPYPLMARIAETESEWNPMAVSHTGDYGLWQLNAKYLDYFSWKFNDGEPIDPHDPWTSTKVACRYIAYLYALSGDYRLSVAAYNCGATRLFTEGAPSSTIKYLTKVFGYEVEI